jgi:hypothetical protein
MKTMDRGMEKEEGKAIDMAYGRKITKPALP